MAEASDWAVDVDLGPALLPLALRARTGREPLPGPPGDPCGEDLRLELPGVGDERVGAGHGQDIAGLAVFKRRPQVRVVAVDLLSCDPAGWCSRGQSPGHHVGGELGLRTPNEMIFEVVGSLRDQ